MRAIQANVDDMAIRQLETGMTRIDARLADPTICFMSVNTPDELARARALLAAGL